MTPLHQAVKLGHLRCIDFLIQYHAEINIVDGKSGKTPLYLAFECNEKYAADLLLSHGADVNIPTYSGCTLIQAANHRGQKLLNNNIRTLQVFLFVSMFAFLTQILCSKVNIPVCVFVFSNFTALPIFTVVLVMLIMIINIIIIIIMGAILIAILCNYLVHLYSHQTDVFVSLCIKYGHC